MADVSFEQVAKSYQDTRVIDGLDLKLHDGGFTVLVGPSGCGKSTTLRMLAGLEEVTAGRIYIGERDVTRLEPRHRDIAMVFQNYALYPRLTVEENIAFPLRARGKQRREALEQARGAAEFTGIAELLRRRPRQLSGGQQQRVAIARAIVRTPSVFLFDEPLSNLDAKLRVEMRSEILRIQQTIGTTALYVTHDQEEAMTLSDQMVVMNQGAIAQVGAPAEIYARPATTFVASFVGSPTINLIEGEIIGGYVRSSDGCSLPVPGARPGPAVVGVRPEDLTVHVAKPSERPGVDPGVASVELTELIGPRVIVSALLGDKRVQAVVEASSATDIEAGAVVRLGVRPGGHHRFSRVTLERED